jgi:integrase
MATIRMTRPWRDPRTGILYLRKRIPQQYRAVSGRVGEAVKISTGTTDPHEAARVWPDVLRRYAEMEAAWERRLHVVSATPETAAQITATWAAWIAGGAPLEMGEETSDVFEPRSLPEERTPERLARMWDRVEAHADEAVRVAGVEIAPETRPVLLAAMLPVVEGAYLQADLHGMGLQGHPAVRPFDEIRATLPAVAGTPPPTPPQAVPVVRLADIFADWKLVATVKPRAIDDTRYIIDMLTTFLGHDDAARITAEDLIAWRTATKAAKLSNNTWNNRLSHVGQVFAHALTERSIKTNPVTNELRLKKSRGAARLPFTDEDALAILRASRKETRASLRWTHWIMAFTGMRVGEAMQLTRGDVREEGGIHYLSVHEDDVGKTVKSSERRNVPVHPALIREGFLAYVDTLPADGPVFPDKRPDKYGNRGGRAWNVVGKWVRKVVGITDPRKVPDHAWRHRVEDDLRAAEVGEDMRDAVVGHARKTVGRQYGIRGEALRRLHEAVSRIPEPAGLFAET